MLNPVRVAVLGDLTAPEFAAVRVCLGDSVCALRLDELLVRTELDPGLIVCLQSWPDQYPAAQVDQLRRAFPLARWIVVTGAWCDSDGRSRRSFPDAERVPVGEFPQRWAAEWAVAHGQAPPQQVLPATATRDEVFVSNVTRRGERASRDLPAVYVVSPDRELRAMFLAHWQQAGGQTTESPDEATVILHDLDPWHVSRFPSLVQFRVPVLGWSGWPASIPDAEWQAAGVVEVVSKLLSPAALQARLQAWQRPITAATHDGA